MRGFTVVETMVAIAITMLLSTMLLTFNRSTEKQIALFKDQAVVIGVLNRAKALAIEKFNQNINTCAFGVHFKNDSQEFFIFQDLLETEGGVPIFGCRNLDTDEFYSNHQFDEGEQTEAFSLDNRLKFSLSGDLDIVFIPPEISVKSSEADGLPTEIKIETLDGSKSALVKVEEAGQLIVQ